MRAGMFILAIIAMLALTGCVPEVRLYPSRDGDNPTATPSQLPTAVSSPTSTTNGDAITNTNGGAISNTNAYTNSGNGPH
jgi:hypothetical protein